MNIYQRNIWTKEEAALVLKGVEECGYGKWADIKEKFFKESIRTQIDIKDKYRNMTKNTIRN